MAKRKTPKQNGNGHWRNRIIGSEMVAASQLLANPSNWRIHPQAQQDALGGALEQIGWIQDVIVNQQTGHLIDGHLRVTLALRQGDETPVPVKYVDLSEAEEKVALATIDPLSAMAVADKEQLDALLREVNTDSAALQAMLADVAKDAGLYPPQTKDAEPQLDRAEELRAKWGVETGQMWQLGAHRLICGDCTDAAVVARVMGGDKAEIAFTSPPYNAGVSAKLRGNTSVGDSFYKDDKDNKQQDVYLEFLQDSINAVLPHCAFAFFNLQLLAGNTRALCALIGWASPHLCDIAIWDKSHAAPAAAQRVMNSVFEFVLVLAEKNVNRAIGCKDWRGTVDNVWRFPPQRNNDFADVHAATMPVAFAVYVVDTFTNHSATVIDPFLGSGTTLIACENLGRKCRAVEISPAYCAVTLERYLTATGKTPVLMAHGTP